jgi:hypothetical protein
LSSFGGLVWLAAAALADDPPGAYRADSPEPTSAETLALEYINRCRANPAEDAARCLQAPVIPRGVDREMFRQEMSEAKPAPPLVFNLALVKAARWHSYYQALNDQVHVEDEGKPGYTGKTPMPRTKLAGFVGGMVGENIARRLGSVWQSHAGFVIDWAPPDGPGGMQPGRGHRHSILEPQFRVVGIGIVKWPSGEDCAITHEFGANDQRMLGGVLTNDRNHSGFYEPGKGVGGVPISTGKAHSKSWASGAYAVELPESKAKLTVELEGEKYACVLPDGKDNLKIDVNVADLPLFKQASKLLAAVKKIPEDEANERARFVPLVNLYLATQGMLVEEGALEEITTLVAQVRGGLDKDMATVRKAAGGDSAEMSVKDIQAIGLKYAQTKALPWFNDATACARMRDAYLHTKALCDGSRPPSASTLSRAARDQEKKLAKLKVPEWRKVGTELVEKTSALGGSPAAGN